MTHTSQGKGKTDERETSKKKNEGTDGPEEEEKLKAVNKGTIKKTKDAKEEGKVLVAAEEATRNMNFEQARKRRASDERDKRKKKRAKTKKPKTK